MGENEMFANCQVDEHREELNHHCHNDFIPTITAVVTGVVAA
jgi:hypothetical protein